MHRGIVEWARNPWPDLTERERVLLRRFGRLATLVAVFVVVIPFTVAFILIDRETNNRIADQAQAAAEIARSVAHDECVNTNGRHDATIAVFQKLYKLDKNGKALPELTAQEAAQAEEGYVVIVSVVNALAPRRKCSDINPTGGSTP